MLMSDLCTLITEAIVIEKCAKDKLRFGAISKV
jgi:hypothetical protein